MGSHQATAPARTLSVVARLLARFNILQLMFQSGTQGAAASSSTGKIREHPGLLARDCRGAHSWLGGGNEEEPVAAGSGIWGFSFWERMDGLLTAGREAQPTLHLRKCKTDSAQSPSWALHFSETTSVV